MATRSQERKPASGVPRKTEEDQSRRARYGNFSKVPKPDTGYEKLEREFRCPCGFPKVESTSLRESAASSTAYDLRRDVGAGVE